MYQKWIDMKDGQMQKWQTMCPTDTYKKKDANGIICQYTHYLYHMLNITILPNGITYYNLY